MHNGAWREAVAILAALLTACAPGGAASDSPAAASADRGSVTLDSGPPRTGANTSAPETPAPSTHRASPPRDERVTGGPQRTPEPPRSSGCGGIFVNVTVRHEALDGTTLQRVANQLLAPVGGTVGAPSLSPAIRAFRIRVRDEAAADRAVTQLRASPKVEGAERDECAAMIPE